MFVSIAALVLFFSANFGHANVMDVKKKIADHEKAFFKTVFNVPEKLHIVKNHRGLGTNLRGAHVAQQTAGWVYGYIFSQDMCGGEQILSTGLITETCLAPPDALTSYLVTCTDDSYIQATYNSSNCDPVTILTLTQTNFSCISIGGSFSAQLQCSAAASVTLGANYILHQSFNDASCQAPLQFSGVRNGACVPLSTESSALHNFPSGTVYGSPDCSGDAVTSFTLPDLGMCVEDNTGVSATKPTFTYSNSALLDTVSTSV